MILWILKHLLCAQSWGGPEEQKSWFQHKNLISELTMKKKIHVLIILFQLEQQHDIKKLKKG